ncbi:MAG: isoprenyl transferase [Alphaproteobacteria bacterium]|nr:isoprenyl transferase [Alphaproteobacteria bacterium]
MTKTPLDDSPKDKKEFPEHIAIIMDGNGRWAQKRGLPRIMGHKKGAEAVRRTIEAAAEFGIKYITLFGFSSENWSRPEQEINDLMDLLRQYLRSQISNFHKKNARLSVIGNRSAFDNDIIELIANAENLTRDNNSIHVIIALNYGGKHDIAQACQKFIQKGGAENLDAMAIEQAIADNLYTAGIPDPDLMIRTSGEMRISNFLLWQCAYAEMIFTPTLWPDFGRNDLLKALDDYAGRERRYGGLKQSGSA